MSWKKLFIKKLTNNLVREGYDIDDILPIVEEECHNAYDYCKDDDPVEVAKTYFEKLKDEL